MRLKISLSEGEDGYVVAECPALHGCVSQGRDRDEALRNIREAIEGWLEAASERFPTETPRETSTAAEVEV